MAVPFPPAAARDYLLSQPEFLDLVLPQNVSSRDYPDEITEPFVLITASTNAGPDPVVNKPLVRIITKVPKLEVLGGSVDPEELAWDITSVARDLLSRARNVSFRNCAWTGHWVNGPSTLPVDKTRGVDFPLYGATCQVEFAMKVNRT